MAAKMTVKLTKGSKSMKASPPHKGGPLVSFNLQDNGDLTFTVFGVDAAGAQVDISSVATLTATSDNTAIVTVDPPTGMSSAIHAPVPAPAVGATTTIHLTATWNDNSVGPFTIDWPQTITAGPVTGIVVSPGTPSIH